MHLPRRRRAGPALLLACAAFLAAGCERKPIANSAPYLAAHGIVDGRPATLRIGGVALRFLPEHRLQPYTSDEIVAGQADSADFETDLADALAPPARGWFNREAVVEIHLHPKLFEHAGRRPDPVLVKDWDWIRARRELGLREYGVDHPNMGGAWGYRSYVPLDANARTPRGGLLIYACAGSSGREPSVCRLFFKHPNGLGVDYKMSATLLPQWRAVQAEVLRRLEAMVVQPASRGM